MRAYVCIRGGLGYRGTAMGDKMPTIHATDDMLQLYGVQGHDIYRLRMLNLHEAYKDHAGHTWVCVCVDEAPQKSDNGAPWDWGNRPWD